MTKVQPFRVIMVEVHSPAVFSTGQDVFTHLHCFVSSAPPVHKGSFASIPDSQAQSLGTACQEEREKQKHLLPNCHMGFRAKLRPMGSNRVKAAGLTIPCACARGPAAPLGAFQGSSFKIWNSLLGQGCVLWPLARVTLEAWLSSRKREAA